MRALVYKQVTPRLASSRVAPPATTAAAQRSPATRFAHDFSRIPARATLQAKLAISAPHDPAEEEADRLAAHVLHASTQAVAEEEENEEEFLEESEAESLQAKEIANEIPVMRRDTEAQLCRMRADRGEPLPDSVRADFEPLFGHDFSRVRIHSGAEAAHSAKSIQARAYTVGRDVVFGAHEYAPSTHAGRLLLAHELAHVIQQSVGLSAPGIMRQKGKFARKFVGWIVKVGERKLIKTTAIYTEKQMATLLGKGSNILVRRGRSVAKRVAKKVWGSNVIHHAGHIVKKTGKKGLSHFQPAKRLLGRPGEKGWHIFYSAAPILFIAEDVEALEIYEDKYPGPSIANYLTVTKYAGEDSWLSYLDWINPGELIAMGGDLGRDLDRERTKELRAIVFNRVAPDGTIQTYELDPEGHLLRVIVVKGGQQKALTADEYYEFLAKNTPEAETSTATEDGTKHPNYGATLDAEYRIYIAKGANDVYDAATQSYFTPMEYGKRLKRIGQFYVSEIFSDHVYVYAHPRFRQTLGQPGFVVPKDMLADYHAGAKEAFLDKLLQATLKTAQVKGADLWRAK